MKALRDIKSATTGKKVSGRKISAIVKAADGSLLLLDAGTGINRTSELPTDRSGKEIHHVHISQITGKDTSETEKNLKALLETATSKNWILFFDEADGLFHKRTGINNAHDRYASRKCLHILKLLQSHPDVVLLFKNPGNGTRRPGKERLLKIMHLPAT